MDGTMGSGAESDDGASFDSESIDAESEKSVKNEGKCSATTTSTYSSTHVAEDAPHFVMQSLESLALANSEASETVQDTSKSLLQEESRDHGRVAVLKDGFDILDLAPNKSISHESIPATENGKHLSAYNADREDQSNRQGYLSSLGRGASARNYGALKKSAARVLHNIIAASVQAPPIPPHSPHTQLYGPCGGLLFQLMFLRGSIKDAEERAATLVRLFAQQIMKHAILARDPLLSEEEVSPRARKAAHNLKGELSVAQWSSGMGHLLFHPAGSSPTHSRENQSNDRAESSVQSANGVIFHNLHGFNNLLVDLLTLKMIKLGNIVPYFAKLLSHATLTWPKPPLEELRVQVANICIVSLSKPSAERVTTGEMTLVHLLLSKALSPPWPMKKMLDYLVSALLRVYTNQPWPVTSEVAEGQRRELAARCLRVVMRAHDGREELKKALSLNTVTQRTSLCKGIAAALLMKEETDALIAFEAYCSSNAPLLQALISGRLKAKTEHALKLLLKKRNEFVQHIKKLNEEFRCGTQPKDKHHTAVLAQSFTAGFTSRVGSIALLEPTRWHWLTLSCCSLEHDDARLRTLYYVDARRNRSKVVVRDTRFISDNGALHTGEQHRRVASTGTATSGAGTSCQSVSLMNAGHCEQQASHMSTLLLPFPLRCRPYIIHGTVPFIDSRIEVTPSAVTLLQYLLQPREVLRFICNGFHVYGINVTPCLILLTDSALKVFGFSHVTEEGDIVICDKEDGSGGEGQSQEIKPPFVTTEDKCGLEEGEKQGHRHFNNLAHHVTKKLRRFLAEGVGGGGGGRKYREKEAHKDGTRVAQSVKHASGQSYKDLYWVYPVRNISGMRLAQYMHQDTAIILELMYDDGPMLSIVDSKQSMNTRVRDAFIGTLQDVLGTRRCVFQDHYKMHSLMRHTLACWVAGSMSTFDYLTVLNRAAGRTVLDYNQYPVFPWVIADYRSDTLVLESESSYRDLSMPMGAQTEARRQAVGQMFSQMVEIQQQEEDVKGLEDVGGESEKTLCRTWPFHHGTHYSTGGGVLHYLIRVEPFTTFARIFQGGELDVAARLFDSVEGPTNRASMDQRTVRS
ncbi:Beige BEACH domain [Trypanosoma vivax]|nr:Beige BEACH domain [Trypanosoma vivax]